MGRDVTLELIVTRLGVLAFSPRFGRLVSRLLWEQTSQELLGAAAT